MPYGLICTCLGVCIGGLAGGLLKRLITDQIRDVLPMFVGLTAICTGLTSVVQVRNGPVLTMSVILGGWIGTAIGLEKRVRAGFGLVLKRMPVPDGFDMERYITIVSVFCASGFGMYAVMVESFGRGSSLMFSKALMDLFVALIFGANMGVLISIIAVPQAAVFLLFFLLAKLIAPVMTEDMLMNFMATGGALTMAAGMRMAGIRAYPVIDLLPALPLVLLFTPLWAMIGI